MDARSSGEVGARDGHLCGGRRTVRRKAGDAGRLRAELLQLHDGAAIDARARGQPATGSRGVNVAVAPGQDAGGGGAFITSGEVV